MLKRSISIVLIITIILSCFSVLNVCAATGQDVVNEAKKWIGTKYGHSDGSGGPGTSVDCCGLVLQTYKKFGYTLPWTVEGYGNVTGQKDLGTKITNNIPSKNYSNLQMGDLIVFYGHSGTIWHIGIYSGNGYVINAQSIGVKEAYLNDYWYKYAVGVRRILGSVPSNPNKTHTHSYDVHYEATHPHRQYRKCSCGHTEFTGKLVTINSCSQCNPPSSSEKPKGISDETKTLRWKELNSKYDVTTKELQECLNYIMNAGLKVDGKYGINTHDVVKEFQGKYGLKVDGDAGPKTLAKVNEVLKGMGGTHTHSFGVHYEATHPHRQYRKCTCGHTEYTGKNVSLDTCSQCTTPGKASLLNLKESYIEGTEIQFSWEPTENTTHYNLYIAKCDTNGKYESYENIFYAESGMTKALQPGKYQVLLQPTNSKAWTDDKSTWRFSNSDLYYFEVLEKHTHTYATIYESAHPHAQYKECICGDIQYTGETKKFTSCEKCYPHQHDYVTKYEKTHPHKKYMECSCGEIKYTSVTKKLEGCEVCFPIVQKKVLKLQIGIPTMYVDGNSQEIDPGRGTAPVIQNDRTLLPIRMVMETFGAFVLWDEIENKVTIDAGTTMMNFWINSTRAIVNGQEYTMDVAPIINNDRTYMPLRFIAEKLGLSVGWNETNQTITIEGSL